MKETTLKTFFDNYSQNVDNADKLGYWKLSDSIIEHIIQKHINASYDGKKMRILDAGCGTGRWIEKIIEMNPEKDLEFIAYDLFSSMLNKARENLRNYTNVQFIQGDLQDITGIESDSIDFCISIYSPISFVDDSNKVIGQIKKILKPWSEALIMGHSHHNAIDSKINNYLASSEELTELLEKNIVRWNSMLPPLNVYSIEDFQRLGEINGFPCTWGYGITIYAKPQNEDWDPKNAQKSKISHKIETDKSFFDTLFEIEIENNSKPELINRWINIMWVFKKD